MGAAVVACVSLVSPARADDDAARKHFREGVELYDKKDYERALRAFDAAYREKPSAGIKLNIGLSLRGTGKLAAAATALDEALDEGRGSLKPETRTAIEQELAELAKLVVTIHVKVVTFEGETKVPVEAVLVSIANPATNVRALAAGAHRRPIRLDPNPIDGYYTLSVHAQGFADPPARKLAPLPGEPVDVTFVVGGGDLGILNVPTNVPNARIAIDGVEVSHDGTYVGKAKSGTRRVEVSAEGYRTMTLDLIVPAGGEITNAITLEKIGEAPPHVGMIERSPERVKRGYVAGLASVGGGSYRLSAVLDEGPEGKRRAVAGASIGAHAGYFVSKRFAAELLAEIGVMGRDDYKTEAQNPNVDLDASVRITTWQVTPMLRFATPGKVRFTTGLGLGVHGVRVDAKLPRLSQTDEVSGSGVAFSGLWDIGGVIDTGPVFLEGLFFLDVHGVGPVRGEFPHDRLLLSSPALRYGLRLGLGIPF